MIVEKLSIGYLVFLFILYVVIHASIIIWYKKLEEKSTVSDEDTRKVLKFLSNWFHVIYGVMILIWLLTI